MSVNLRKDVEVRWENSTKEQEDSFEKHKTHLANPPILRVSEQGCPYMVDTDAIQYELGAILLQEQYIMGYAANHEFKKEWVAVGYCS